MSPEEILEAWKRVWFEREPDLVDKFSRNSEWSDAFCKKASALELDMLPGHVVLDAIAGGKSLVTIRARAVAATHRKDRVQSSRRQDASKRKRQDPASRRRAAKGAAKSGVPTVSRKKPSNTRTGSKVRASPDNSFGFTSTAQGHRPRGRWQPRTSDRRCPACDRPEDVCACG